MWFKVEEWEKKPCLTDPADAEIGPTTLSRPLKLPPPSNSTHEHIAFVLPGRMWRAMWPPPCISIAMDPHGDVDAADSRGRSNPGQHALAGVLMEDAEHSCPVPEPQLIYTSNILIGVVTIQQ